MSRVLNTLLVCAAFFGGALLMHYFGSERGNGVLLAGRFEGNGAFTVGCRLWDVPKIYPYGEDNPDTGTFLLSSDGAGLILIFDGLQGTVLVSGQSCGASVDYRRFPTELPAPGDE